MVKGRIWGTVCGEYYEMEIEECDVIVASGFKVPDKDDIIESQAVSLGYGLTSADFVSAIAGSAVRIALDHGDSPEEKKALLRLLADEINRLTRKSGPSVDELLEMILREVKN